MVGTRDAGNGRGRRGQGEMQALAQAGVRARASAWANASSGSGSGSGVSESGAVTFSRNVEGGKKKKERKKKNHGDDYSGQKFPRGRTRRDSTKSGKCNLHTRILASTLMKRHLM